MLRICYTLGWVVGPVTCDQALFGSKNKTKRELMLGLVGKKDDCSQKVPRLTIFIFGCNSSGDTFSKLQMEVNIIKANVPFYVVFMRK